MARSTEVRAMPEKEDKLVRKRILIVDDDQESASSLAMLLEGDYSVHVASNGFSALDRLHKDHYHLILLDLMMPGLDGAGFLEELRLRAGPPPVLVISGLDNVAHQAAHLGISDYLMKPFDITKLEEKVRRLIG